jgi:hypothetical protein
VGLDRTEIGEQLRGEMGGARASAGDSEVFEAADPARTMPKWLVLGAIAAVILLVVVLTWLNNRSLSDSDEPQVAAPQEQAGGSAPATAPTPAPAQGPVVITANEPVWLQVYEKGGATIFQGELAAGQRFDVPPGASAPMLRTGKPQALRISVGTADAPPVGPPATTVRDVSLLGPDLMRAGQNAGPAQPPAPTAPTGR